MQLFTIQLNWLTEWNNWDQILATLFATSAFVVAIVVFYSWRKRKSKFLSKTNSNKSNQIDPLNLEYKPRHNWKYNDLFSTPTYCNGCEELIVAGICCTFCGIYSDERCLKKVDNQHQCKKICNSIFTVSEKNNFAVKCPVTEALSDLKNGPFKLYKQEWSHHWIKGNLELNTFCFLCMNECCDSPGLNDFRCVWCLRNVHEECLNSSQSSYLIHRCDFGKLQRILLTPKLVVQTKKSNKLGIKDVRLDEDLIKSIYRNDSSKWTPLFVFANSKSGSKDAVNIIYSLTRVLNPLQVIEMNKISPDEVISWMADYSDFVKFKILVCGGDGSVGWLLESLSKFVFKKFEPVVGILPLGTGNDLSRILNWGAGYSGEFGIQEILSEIDVANEINLDRWLIRISKIKKYSATEKEEENILMKANKKYMNNYLSVGCDALVTLNFHRQRNNMLFANRFLNKLVYFKYGTIDTFMKECHGLSQNVQLEMDGKIVEIPHLESIVVLNIPYWGGGVKAWEIGIDETTPKQSINDGVLEVFGIYSSFHIAQMQVGLAEPYRIGQAKRIRMRLKNRFPVQIDGEPFEQPPGIIDISFFNQKTMLEKVEIKQELYENDSETA